MFHQENFVLIAMIVVQFGNRQVSDAAGAPHPGTRLPVISTALILLRKSSAEFGDARNKTPRPP
jgi:hypothetical protein